MASGAIIGDCPICRELIWEDEDFTVDHDSFQHRNCLIRKANDDILKKIGRLNSTNARILTELLNVLLLAQEDKA
jgi:hypothetical protein